MTILFIPSYWDEENPYLLHVTLRQAHCYRKVRNRENSHLVIF